ncbi:MAG TPA: hypothetical protein VED37_11420 [Ktedonobacteraceae bacterium]|nr:hypothetical protein [Ktedonobacteraceae bacterium]
MALFHETRSAVSAAVLNGGAVMKAGRVTILVGAGILLVIVLIVSFWVIPSAAANTSPAAPSPDSVDSFRTVAIADACFGLAMLGATFLARYSVSIALLVIAGIGALFFGFQLMISFFASTETGSGIQDMANVLFWCVVGQGVAVLLAFAGAGLLAIARNRKREPNAT